MGLDLEVEGPRPYVQGSKVSPRARAVSNPSRVPLRTRSSTWCATPRVSSLSSAGIRLTSAEIHAERSSTHCSAAGSDGALSTLAPSRLKPPSGYKSSQQSASDAPSDAPSDTGRTVGLVAARSRSMIAAACAARASPPSPSSFPGSFRKLPGRPSLSAWLRRRAAAWRTMARREGARSLGGGGGGGG